MTQEEHLESSHQPSNSVYDQISDDSEGSKNNAASNQLGCARSNTISEKTDTADRALASGDKVIEDINRGGPAVDHSGKSKDEAGKARGDQNNDNLEMTVISHQGGGENIREIQTEIENSEKSACVEGDNSGENTEVIQKDCENPQDTPSENVNGNEEKKGASDKVSSNRVDASETAKSAQPTEEDDPFARLKALKANISNVLSQVKAVLTEHGVDTANEPEKDSIKPAEENAIRFRFVRRIRKRSVFDEDEKKETSEKNDGPGTSEKEAGITPQGTQQVVQPQSGSTSNREKEDIQIIISQPDDDKQKGYATDQNKITSANEIISGKCKSSTYEPNKIVPTAENKENDIPINVANNTAAIVTSELSIATSGNVQSQEIKNQTVFQVKVVEIQNKTEEPRKVINCSKNGNAPIKVETIVQPQETTAAESKQNDAESIEIKDEMIADSSSTTEESQESSLSIGAEYEVKVVDVISVAELPALHSSNIKKTKVGEKLQKKSAKTKPKITPKVDTIQNETTTEKVSVKTKKIKGDAETPKKKERKSSLVKEGCKIESQPDEKKKITTKTKSKKLESSNKEILPNATEISAQLLVPTKSKDRFPIPSKAAEKDPIASEVAIIPVPTSKTTTSSTTAAPSKEVVTKPPQDVIAHKTPGDKEKRPVTKQDQSKVGVETKIADSRNKKASVENILKSEKISPNSSESALIQKSLPQEAKTVQAKLSDSEKVSALDDKSLSNPSILTIPKELSLPEKGKPSPQNAVPEVKETKTTPNTASSPLLPKVEQKPLAVLLVPKEVPKVNEELQVLPEKITSKMPSKTQKEVPIDTSSSYQPKSAPTSALEKVLATTNLKLITEPRPPILPQTAPPTNPPKSSVEKIVTQNTSPTPKNLEKDATQESKCNRKSLPAAIPSNVTQSEAIATSSLRDEEILLKPDPSKTSSQQTPTPPAEEESAHDDKSTPHISKEIKKTEKSKEKNSNEKAEEQKSVDKVPLKIEPNKIRTVSVKPTLTLLPSPAKAVELAPKKLELVPVPTPSKLAVVQVHPKKDKAVVTQQHDDEQHHGKAAEHDAISIPPEEEKRQEESTGEKLPDSPVSEKDEKPKENEKSEEGAKSGEDEKPEGTVGKKLGPKKRKMKKKVVIKRLRRRLSTDGTIARQDSLENAEPEICEKVIGVKPLEPEPEPEPEVEEEKPPPGPKSCLKLREYQPGDIVLYADRIKKIVKWKKAEVLERITSISYKLNVEGEEKSCHICYIKKYTGKKVQFGGKEYLEIDYAQEESSDEEEVYNIWSRV